MEKLEKVQRRTIKMIQGYKYLINQSIFVLFGLLPAKTAADTAATEVFKTRVRLLLYRTKVGMVNYGRIMQFLQKLSSVNVLVQ